MFSSSRRSFSFLGERDVGGFLRQLELDERLGGVGVARRAFFSAQGDRIDVKMAPFESLLFCLQVSFQHIFSQLSRFKTSF
jgi:hypothetical protein